MPRKARRTAGRWDGKVLPQLQEAERQAWLAIFEAGVELTDPSDKHACAPTLRVAIGPELRLDPLAMYLRSDPTYLRSDPHVPSLGPTPTPMYLRSDPPVPSLGPPLRPPLRADPSCDRTLSPLRLAIGPRLHGMRAFACMRLHAHHVCTAHSAHVQAGVVRARACFDDGDAHPASVP